MRFAAFLDLVVRRVWAKRGLLAGSLIGATLVTALLVVVPLYESSVQAVDLRFSLSTARANEVDIWALANHNDYVGSVAGRFRDLVETERSERIDEWYPELLERTISRSFVTIPTGPDEFRDYVAEGRAWTAEVARILAEAEAEGNPEPELPPAPFPTIPIEPTTFRVLTSPDIADRLRVVAGEWPESLASTRDGEAPMPVIAGTRMAEFMGGLGKPMILKPVVSPANQFELAEVVAIVEPVDPADPFWGADVPENSVFYSQDAFEAIAGPLPVDRGTDPWGRQVRGFPGLPATQRFTAEFIRDSLQLEELPEARRALAGLAVGLAQDTEGALIASTPITRLFDRFDVRSVVVGAPILAMLALVVGGALYFLVFSSALAVEREGPELALLRSRGASSSQTVGIHLAQSLVVAIVAALLAPLVGRSLIAVTGRVPPLSDLTGGGFLEVTQIDSLLPYMAVGALVTFIAMGLAIVPSARKRVLELRSLAARPTQSSIWQRYNLDLFAIAISVVLLAQLVQRGFIIREGNEVTLDPLAVAFPALLLFTGALTVLRLLPLVLRIVGHLMTRSRGLSLALPGWHLGRNPVPYGRLALLIWLTSGFGAFALTYAATLNTSFEDRAAFVAGTDLRIIADDAGLLAAPPGLDSTGVYRTTGGPVRAQSRPAELIAVDPAEFASIVAWRDDFATDTPSVELGRLRPNGPPDVGVELAMDATGLRLDGLVVPRDFFTQNARDELKDQSLRWLVKVLDARGMALTYQAATDLVDTGWETVEIDLAEPLNELVGDIEPPLTLHSVWFERSKRARADGDRAVTNTEAVLVSDIIELTPGAATSIRDDVYEELKPAFGIHVDFIAANHGRDVYYNRLPEGVEEPTADELAASPFTRDGDALRIQLPLRDPSSRDVPQLRRLDPDILAIGDPEALGNAGLGIGERAVLNVDSQRMPGRIVGVIDELPTLVDPRRQGFVVVDYLALSAVVNGPAAWSYEVGFLPRVTTPQELWIATDDADLALRRLAIDEARAEIVTRTGSAADISSRPVQVGLVAILFIGAATSVVLALAGVTSYVLLAVTRRTKEMGVLRALGFPRRGVATTFTAEQVVVLGVGAIVGTLGGIGLTWAMLPFFQLGETAREIEPEVLLNVPWPVLLGYVVVVGLLMIGSVAWATRRVSARRMSEVLREVER